MTKVKTWLPISTIIFFVAVLLLSLSAFRLPRVLPADAPAERFSAQRAAEALKNVLRNQAPHPMGSAQNAGVRERIESVLRSYGYEPAVESGWATTMRIGHVENVVARLRGNRSGPPVLLTAHYDSVPTASGAADDGMGIAIVLETARALKAGPRPDSDIVFLLSDGEEFASLGATAYQARHSSMNDFKAFVNIDGGDCRGPFWLAGGLYLDPDLARVAGRLPHPMFAFWDVSPLGENRNGVDDFRIYSEAGRPGIDLKTYRMERTYHTPLDTLESVNWQSIQHGGETALLLTRELAGEFPANPSGGPIARVDFLGRRTLWWKLKWSYALVGCTLLTLVLAVTQLFRSGRLNWKGLLISAATQLLSLFLLLLLGFGLMRWGARLTAPAMVLVWVACCLLAFAITLSIARRSSPEELWTGSMILLAIVGCALFGALPLLGHPLFLMILPACLLLLSLPSVFGRELLFSAAMLSVTLGSALLIFDLYCGLFVPLGLLAGTALVFFILAPLIAIVPRRWALRVGACGVTVLLLVVAAGRRSEIRHCSIFYFENADTGAAEWQSGIVELDPVLKPEFHSASFTAKRVKSRPWWPSSYMAAAPALNLPAAELTISSVDRKATSTTYSAHLSSRRNAASALLIFPGEAHIQSVETEGQVLHPTIGEGGWTWISLQSLPENGLDLTLVLGSAGPTDVIVVDSSYGLPKVASELQQERSRVAVPFGVGDMTVVWRAVHLH